MSNYKSNYVQGLLSPTEHNVVLAEGSVYGNTKRVLSL